LLNSNRLQWFSRDGKVIGAGPQGVFASPRLAPDQKTVALSARDQTSNSDIWVLNVARGILSRVTSDPQNDWFPAWMSDSTRLLFGSTRIGATLLFQKSATGVGEEERVSAPSLPQTMASYPDDVSADGKFALLHASTPNGYDIRVLPLPPGEPASNFASTPFNEVQARFSPNRKWVAYSSDESGRFEVYVVPFPSPTDRVPISVDGGMQPEWRGDGKELFYLSADHKIMAVPVATDGSTFTALTPQALFSVEVIEPNAPYPNDYAVTADGQRFLVNSIVTEANRQTLTVLLNWPAAVKK